MNPEYSRYTDSVDVEATVCTIHDIENSRNLLQLQIDSMETTDVWLSVVWWIGCIAGLICFILAIS
jgi:hypothetical protein